MDPQPNIRLKVPEQATKGEVVEIRAMIMHPMESGFRFDTQGMKVNVHIIERFVCNYNGEEVFSADLNTGVSANPYLSFYIVATQSGELEFVWYDDDGSIYKQTAHMTVV